MSSVQKEPWHFKVDKNFYFEKNKEKRNLSISLITPKQLIPEVKLITFSPLKNIHSEMYSLLIDTYIEDPDEK